jgi:putative transcriptional regulator
MSTSSKNEWDAVRVRKLRARLGLTQEQFAHRLGVSLRTLLRWESGEVVPSRLASLALASVSG